MTLVTCIDVGSTVTKGVLVDLTSADLVASAAHPTTVATDVMEGLQAVCRALGEPPGQVLVCSSAGGGLRIAVVGQEAEVSAEAGRRVALSAGGRVVHVSAGHLDAAATRQLRALAPDVILLVGGTDGGNEEVLLHNVRRLAKARLRAPIVLAGNAEAAPAALELLAATGRRVTPTANVLPRIGEIAPEAARAAIRTVFLEHVIGGKGLSRRRAFVDLVQAPTPDAVLVGVEIVAQTFGKDVMVLDIGGATTDVYSVLTPQGEDATIHRDVVGQLWHARTVEADLGMRWNAEGIVEAATRERVPVGERATRYAAKVVADTAHLAGTAAEWEAERELATAAALVAARRHARPAQPSEQPRPLADVGLLIGSGGVLRHSPPGVAEHVLAAVLDDHAGGWRVPAAAAATVDTDYLLFAIGLLARPYPDAARGLAVRLLADVRQR